MKTGKSISELALEIERQHRTKVDYIADTRKLEVVPTETGVKLQLHNGSDIDLSVNDLCHSQIGERVGIPAKYYQKMLAGDTELLAYNVNRWFQRAPEKRLVRTLDGVGRAFLSDIYRRIDNLQIAETSLPVLAQVPGIEFVSAEITERRMYIKAVTSAVQSTLDTRRVGDVVRAGVIIQNSEVGLGAVSVFPFYDFLACLNGMVRTKDGMRVAHIGTQNEEATYGVLANDTKSAIDHALVLRIRDQVKAAFDPTTFNEAIAMMQAQTQQQVTGSPVKAIEVLGNDFGLLEGEKDSVLRHLITGGDLSRYGLMNAITRTAEDATSYDRATEIETMGGRLLDLPRSSWDRIAVAA